MFHLLLYEYNLSLAFIRLFLVLFNVLIFVVNFFLYSSMTILRFHFYPPLKTYLAKLYHNSEIILLKNKNLPIQNHPALLGKCGRSHIKKNNRSHDCSIDFKPFQGHIGLPKSCDFRFVRGRHR